MYIFIKQSQLNQDFIKQIKAGVTWMRPLEWAMNNRVSTMEERLQKLKDRGVVIDLAEDPVVSDVYALNILKDKGYHLLKEYAKPWVVGRTPSGKDIYQERLSFNLLHEFYYADYEIRGVLFDAITHIEANLRTRLDYACTQEYKHFLWYLNNNVVDFQKFKLTDGNIKTIVNLMCHRECNRRVKYKTEQNLPYSHDFLRSLHLGDLIQLYKALRDEKLKHSIALSYEMKGIEEFCEMLNSVRMLRNAVAHNECLFLKSYGTIAPGDALFTALSEKNPALRGRTPMFRSGQVREGANKGAGTLADAMLVVQYFLWKISKSGRRLERLHHQIRDIFIDYVGAYKELEPVFQKYYAYDVYMAESERDLRRLAREKGYDAETLCAMLPLVGAKLNQSMQTAPFEGGSVATPAPLTIGQEWRKLLSDFRRLLKNAGRLILRTLRKPFIS